ncbi:hypothetical protein ACFLY9_00430 [Patescibacteria group bacterium]
MGEIDSRVTTEMLPTVTPTDKIALVEGSFIGTGYCYTVGEGALSILPVHFNTAKADVLSPFVYKKPKVIDGDIANPRKEWEEKQRESYHPLAIVQNALRGPNHWHRADEALFCAVEVDGEWQTRFFPRQNIEAEVWDKALRIMRVT